MPFTDDSTVVVEQVGDEDWKVRERLEYLGRYDRFTVPVGMVTDFASVPRAFVWFLPRYGAYTMAAILHDYLWRDLAATGEMRWVDADGIFRRAMRELRVPFLRRWIMWAAVRWGALTKPRGREGWLGESWRVLLFTLLSLPFVAPPALLILVALAAFFVLELLLWVPIKLTELARRRAGRAPRKQVNMPSLDLKTTR